MHDRMIEERVRAVLRAEAQALPLTVTTDELERRLALRRRERSNRRVGLLAAGIGAVAVGTVFALAVGPFRGPNVAATPEPSVTPTVEPSAPPNAGPAALPTLEPSASAVDFHRAGQFARPGTDATPEITHIDGVRMDAREAGIKFVCAGPDVAELTWGYPLETAADETTVAHETVMCDSVVREFRYDIASRQPLIDDLLAVVTSRRVAFQILVETFGFTSKPRPASLAPFATPRGDIVLDVSAHAAATEPVGRIPARPYYRVAMACLGSGNATWSIGAIGGGTYVASGEVPCDGAALGFVAAKGILSSDPSVYVDTASGNEWHIVATSPSIPPVRPVPFTPPAFEMYAGADLEGQPASAPAQCVAVDGSGDSCGIDLDSRDGARTIGVPLDSDVGFVVKDGWTITQASVQVADRDAVRTDPTSAEQREFATLSDGSRRMTASDGRMTLSVKGLEPGEWMLIVTIRAEKGSRNFGATYQLPLRIGG